ncbi:MAG TPA: ROK family protein [Fimbriimonadaceae bacterium]|nr:ROK family protein [Fimbriimonadaceae bacterium]
MQRHCVIGVDLGGTNVRARAYYDDGSPASGTVSNPSHGQSGVAAILNAAVSTISQARDAAEGECAAVGLAVPGFANNDSGVVVWAPNLGELVNGVFKYLDNVDFRTPLEKGTGLKVHMNNDANLAALGEYKFGSGRNSASCLVMLTVGTGIGGGVVMSPNSVLGPAGGPLVLIGGNKGGAELGHTVVLHNGVECNAGTYGSVESYCQRDSIIRRAGYRIARKRPTLLNEMLGGDVSKLTPKHLSEAAAKGDEVALEVWEEVGTMLGVAIGSFINIFSPDVVAIGGQIAKAGEFLLAPARKTARNVAVPVLFADAKIVQAEQIDDAGLLGGAALALESLHWT